jgi:hypothetical protein
MSVAANVERKLKEIASRMSGSVEVGFLENAKYDDGTPVAAVAFWDEYGASGPPRPFFRNMIAKEMPSWPDKVASEAKRTNNNGPEILAAMGLEIQGALIQSINDFTTPGNADSTIARKGFDKPLIESSHMVNSTGYRVIK